jgi:TrmH family RNA methyltransferase
VKIIRSRENPQLRFLLRLSSSARECRKESMTILDGERLIGAFRSAGRGHAELVAASESGLKRPALRELFETTPSRERIALADRLLTQISQVVSTAGMLAVVRIPDPQPLPASVTDGILLDRIQDPGNLGSILRSALAAGLRHVFLTPGCALAWSPKVVRAGMGAHFGLTIFEAVDAAALAQRAVGRKLAACADAPRTLYEIDLRGPVVWLFGNEGAGLTEQAIGAADERIRVPMPGPAESLNVAAAAAVCLFEQVRQRRGG